MSTHPLPEPAPPASASRLPSLDDRHRALFSALLESEQRFRAAFANAAIGFAMTTAEGRYVEVNARYCAITGYSEEELRARTFADLLHPDDRAGNLEQQRRMLASEIPGYVVENRYVRKTGEPVFVRKSVSVLRDAAGAPRWLVALIEDVGERRRAEHELRDSEERARLRAAELEAVLDTVPAAVWIARDPRGDRIDANRFGAELLRRPRGANVSVTSPGEDRPREFVLRRADRPLEGDELPIQRAARFGEEVRGAEVDLLFEDGEVRHLLGNAAPLRDPEGRVKGSVGAFIDVTERREAEEALRDADRRKTEFLALLSHELRNPLASIRNSIVLLERSPADGAAARRAREVLQRQTKQLERLVDDLLDISRIAHGKIEIRPTRLDLREVVRRAAADARALFEQRDVELLLSEPSEPLWLDADAARLAQLLGNLLHNALKFTPPGGRVQVRAARRGAAGEVSVRDSGIGLEPRDLERIFEPFVQAERAGGHAGLGLGLALVRALAAKHGGSVRAESAGPGQGSEFVVQLPLAAAPEPAARRPAARESAERLSVLVVEDNEDAGASIVDLLALDGHRPTLVVDGAAGIAAAQAQPPDVLLCDVGLPDMSGHDVIRRIRAAPGGGRVFAIALTGYAQPQDRDAALAAGFDAHLAKPPPLDELQELLASAARRR